MLKSSSYRRVWVTMGLLAATGIGLGCQSAPRTSVLTAEAQKALTPEEVVTRLKEGNDRFVSNRGMRQDYLAQVRATASGQFPKAVVLSCLDSRIPAEVVFDQGIGDIFVGRVAGNFANTDLIGSMEFATAVAGAKAIVVLGHNECGAVKGAADDARLGNLTATLSNLRPAVVDASTRVAGPHNSKNPAFVAEVASTNVRLTMARILDQSSTLRELVEQDKLVIVGGIYDLHTGRIDWLE